jgi:hypothetical protein
MLHPMPRQIYYSGDVSKPPKAGDKFIQLDWDESSLSLDVGHEIFPDQNSRNPTRRFPASDNLNELGGKPLPAHCALGTLGSQDILTDIMAGILLITFLP